jgi:hypothetical protein
MPDPPLHSRAKARPPFRTHPGSKCPIVRQNAGAAASCSHTISGRLAYLLIDSVEKREGVEGTNYYTVT